MEEKEGNIPFAFECPICKHFPMRTNQIKADLFYCSYCNKDFLLVEGIWSDMYFIRDEGKRGVKNWQARAFYRVKGKSRQRGFPFPA